jgi:type III restriction enzyme
MAMLSLIAWQVLNKAASPQDKRFTRRFLVVAPGVTIDNYSRPIAGALAQA